MEWRDEGVLLSMRPHGESAAIIEAFTEGHGLHAGMVHGGQSRRMAPVLQVGAQLDLRWRARLDDHIGAFSVDPVRGRAAALLQDAAGLAGLAATCALLRHALPEREPHPGLYRATLPLLDRLGGPGWEAAYLRWELRLLEELGFGLDLTRCAVTGGREDLAYVSPRTGRAVSRAGAGDWADRLLPLPPCLLGQGEPDAAEIAAGLRTTGAFLERFAETVGRALPPARARLIARLSRPARPHPG